MFFLSCLRTAPLLLVAALTQAHAAELELGKSAINRLHSLQRGEKLAIEGFPVGPALNGTVRFQRVEIYAPDAHIYVVDEKGKKEVPRSNRTFLRGYTDDRSARVALSLNADGSFADGNGSGPDGSFVLHAKVDTTGAHHFSAQSLEDALPPGYKYDFRCGNEGQSMLLHNPEDLMRKGTGGAQSPALIASASTLKVGVVAVDTDTLFMSQLFSNNTTNATNWIAKMFNTMNTMYEPDLGVVLGQGTTILRTGGVDPYVAASDVPADGVDLDVFGSYWKANYGSVKRSFATLLSGRGPCNSCGGGTCCSASGIAWIDQYCENGFLANGGVDLVGSYSVVQVFANIGIDPNADIAARLTGHELGHNFGADHTHCTNKTTGVYEVATNTIDQCYNGEASSGCFAGTQVCPAGGKGTIMSYCNIGGCAGTQNLLQFNSTQINAAAPYGLLAQMAAAPAGCIVPDEIFLNGFN